MLADAGWLEHKAQTSANWQFREVSLIVFNRHLPEGASTSFPFVSFDSISDEHPCRFQTQSLVTLPHHPHRPLHFLLPLPALNSTRLLRCWNRGQSPAQSGSGPALQQHPKTPPSTDRVLTTPLSCSPRPRPAHHAAVSRTETAADDKHLAMDKRPPAGQRSTRFTSHRTPPLQHDTTGIQTSYSG